LAAGADQQLVATKLQETAVEPEVINESEVETPQEVGTNYNDDGSLDINHEEQPAPAPKPKSKPQGKQTDKPTPPDLPVADDKSDPEVNLELPAPQEQPEEAAPAEGGQSGVQLSSGSKIVTEPPTLGGKLTANSEPEHLDPSTDPMSMLSGSP